MKLPFRKSDPNPEPERRTEMGTNHDSAILPIKKYRRVSHSYTTEPDNRTPGFVDEVEKGMGENS